MKTFFFILAVSSLLIFTSCKKTDNGENGPLIGRWDENTPLMDQEELIFSHDDILYYTTRSLLKYVNFQEFVYELDYKGTNLTLRPVDNPDTLIICRIELNSNKTILTIRGLNKFDQDMPQTFSKVK